MVKRGRRKTNRRNSPKSRSEITRIGFGVPVSQKRVSPDPPMLPHVLAYPVRIRFNAYLQRSMSGSGFVVQLANTPTAANTILIYYHPQTMVYSSVIGLDFNAVFVAAAMRVYGVNPGNDLTGANYLTSEFALQKVTAYGSDNRIHTTTGILLSVDFGGDIPGFVGRDSGGANRRPVISARPPRLSWQKFAPNNSRAFMTLNIGTVRLPEGGSDDLRVPIATVDFSVIVRRSVIMQDNSTPTTVQFIDDEGKIVKTK